MKWPLEPLNVPPTEMESNIAQQMMKLTSLLTNGKVDNVSILELPGFGSTGEYAKVTDKKGIEIFKLSAFVQANFAAMDCTLTDSKDLVEPWYNYSLYYGSDGLDGPLAPIPTETCFNFTQNIIKDISTYLWIFKESFLNGQSNIQKGSSMFPLSKITDQVLEPVYSDEDMNSTYQYYDKLFLRCRHGELDLEGDSLESLSIDCKLFQPSLTSRGLCYSFNSV